MGNILRKLLPTYRVAGAMERQLTAMQEQLQALERQNGELRQEVRNYYWLSQRREGETLEECRKRVFRTWPKAEGDLRKVQQANFLLLKKLKEVCDNHGLTFFLIGGTLLGAVRHCGYIPWDDDIDVGMLREDFDRLREILRADELLRVDLYYNPAVGETCAKVKFREAEAFWVDIFVYDRVEVSTADEREKLRQIREASEALWKEQVQVCQRFYPGRSPEEAPVRDERIDEGIREMCDRAHAGLDFYGHGDGIIETMDMNPLDITHLMLPEEALPFQREGVIFEGETFPVFRKPEAYLKKAYQDYMQLPVSLEPYHLSEVGGDLEKDWRKLEEMGIRTEH